MIKTPSKNKCLRLLDLQKKFSDGEIINKQEFAEEYGVTEKSIQRDISFLNEYLEEQNLYIEYNLNKRGYELKKKGKPTFTEKDILAVSKIIISSKAFSKEEMYRILNSFILQCKNSIEIKKILNNEIFNYVPPKHNRNIISNIWDISSSIRNKRIVILKYKRKDQLEKEYKIKPQGFVFNEYYFYLIAEFVDNSKSDSTVFRLDRIQNYKITNDTFIVADRDRFQEGIFRNKIQFMYTGELLKIEFKFWGPSLEPIFDRLPTAKCIGKDTEGKSIIEAEVYGDGVKRWLLSQLNYLEVTKPQKYRDDIKETLKKMSEIYI